MTWRPNTEDNTMNNPFEGLTWREACMKYDWIDFRDKILDCNPFEVANLQWWKSEYDRIRAEPVQE